MIKLAVALIRLYQYLASPWLGNQCRFYPSCSHYAEQAIVSHGLIRGGLLTLRRLSKCHPWHPGGIDPVPDPHCSADSGSGIADNHHLTHSPIKK
ncbi:membrane protein insertion efficiency factor YidD [Exilibacterium tricleocarpae]|uniref:Putative membrane protein insertion efficiency factor n=1 Tax=Exilibacterium tricleocarpae TaxID=2591008 RepID=A0A545TZS7_9GAMM|nr:membrane protein insertion efficiency factor YidD [Exilibacterium tricleocarpae]TQV82712.1 membrane protein insertion efficiency factor YidD [Exilibacterium tricleocarpae]